MTMERVEIIEKLKEILSKIKPSLTPDKVTEDSRLVEDMGIDSLTMLLLSLAAENEFGIKFEAKEPFVTVREVVDYIKNAKL